MASTKRKSKATPPDAEVTKQELVSMTVRVPKDLHTQLTILIATSGQSANEWFLEAAKRRMADEVGTGWGDEMIAMVNEMKTVWGGSVKR